MIRISPWTLARRSPSMHQSTNSAIVSASFERRNHDGHFGIVDVGRLREHQSQILVAVLDDAPKSLTFAAALRGYS